MFERLAAQLKEAREKKGLSQEALAKLIRMDLAYLRQMESGDFTFLQELYVKAFVKAYAKAVGLSDEIALRKYQLAAEGRSVDEVSFEAPVPKPAPPVAKAPAPAVPPSVPVGYSMPQAPKTRTTAVIEPVAPSPVPVTPVTSPPVPTPVVRALPVDLFDGLPPEEPAQPVITSAPPLQEPETVVVQPQAAPPVQPVPAPTIAVPPIQYARTEPVRRFDDTLEPPPRKKRQLNAMQKRIIMFASLSFLILIVVCVAIYESSESKKIVVEGMSDASYQDTGTTRYEEPAKQALLPAGDSLVLRMEFSDVCWVSVKPDSAGEVSENTFSKNSDPVEFKAAHKFLLNVGNAPAVRLLLNNKEVTFEKKGTGSSTRLEITKDTVKVLAYPSESSETKKKKK